MSKVLLFDSGKGGMSILWKLLKRFPYNDYVYFEDTENMPYGNKTKKEVLNVVCENIFFLQNKYKFDAIIIACNTATNVAINDLRKSHLNIPIIGIEPCVKLAIKQKYSKICVIATRTTTRGKKYKQLVCKMEKFAQIKTVASKKLAMLVEDFCVTGDDKKIVAYLKRIKHCVLGYKCLVLGCTHYSIIKGKIAEILGVHVLDGNDGVVNRFAECVEYSPTETIGSVKFVDDIDKC